MSRSAGPPPPYSQTDQEHDSSQTESPVKKTPSNYMTIIREKGDIKSEFNIDPSLAIHESLRPSLLEGETQSNRNHLNVKALSGEIDIKVHLEPSYIGCAEELEAKINVHSLKGDVVVRLHVPPPDDYRRRCILDVRADDGTIFLLLPQSMSGVVNVTSKGQMIVSDGLCSHFNIQNECGITRKCLIGDIRNSRWRSSEYKKKDVVEAFAGKGRVYLQYNNEAFEKKSIGWWTSVFGTL
ncbi:hypothetical protein VKT23_010092 [Stygiomarasmius scandens]|uniref:DUF7330 domain-containing protein n=1 Tax=Marasmiellus scandens TaxID=2682957 RepID=A0ABR1JCW1_9AGAR